MFIFYTVCVPEYGEEPPYLKAVDLMCGMESKTKKPKVLDGIEEKRTRAELEFGRWLVWNEPKASVKKSPKVLSKKVAGKLMAFMPEDIFTSVIGYLSHKEYHGARGVSRRFNQPEVLNSAMKSLITVGNPVYVLGIKPSFGIISGVASSSGVARSQTIKIVRTGKCMGPNEKGEIVRLNSISFEALLVRLFDGTFAFIPSTEVQKTLYGNNNPAQKRHVNQCPHCRRSCKCLESEIYAPVFVGQEAIKMRTFMKGANMMPLDSGVMSSVLCPLHLNFPELYQSTYRITASYLDGRRLPMAELRMKVSSTPEELPA
jgi:hypothetical protein